MRSVLATIAVFVILLSIAANLVRGSGGPSGEPAGKRSRCSPASAPAADGDAAAKHARRTACIKICQGKKTRRRAEDRVHQGLHRSALSGAPALPSAARYFGCRFGT